MQTKETETSPLSKDIEMTEARKALFWAQTIMQDNGCLEWTGTRHEKGRSYGIFGRGKERRAHRIAWILAHGPIPKEFQVLHKCDNPPCVLYDHLFLGTLIDNMKDRKAKCRYVGLRGEASGSAKFSEETIRTIRKLSEQGKSAAELAREFGVSPSQTRRIIRKETWSHI